MSMILKELYCHTECEQLVCENCRYVSGEYHYRNDVPSNSNDLSVWGGLNGRPGDTCPSCTPDTTPQAVLDWIDACLGALTTGTKRPY